jgi:hypothetical protein
MKRFEVNSNEENLDDERIDFIFTALKCHEIGTIVEFNSVTCRAEVQIMRKEIKTIDREGNRVLKDIASLKDIPVCIIGSAGSGLEIPIQPGDECILMVIDRNFTTYLETNGLIKEPLTFRAHDRRDSVAFVVKILNENYNNERLKLFFRETFITLDEKVSIQNEQQNLINCIESLIDAVKELGNAVKSAKTNPVSEGSPATLDPDTQQKIESALSSADTALNNFNQLLK